MGRELAKLKSSVGTKSVLNPRAWHSAPISSPWRVKNGLRPEAKTEAAEGAGEVIFLRRSTEPPSISTQRNEGVETALRHSASKAWSAGPIQYCARTRSPPPAASLA